VKDSIHDLLDRVSEPADDAVRPHLSGPGYQRLRRSVVLATAVVALAPLLIMTGVNLYQYRKAMRNEMAQPVSRLTLNTKRSLEFFLEERRSALAFIIEDRSYEALCDRDELTRIMTNMNRSQSVGAFVDLGLINSDGDQLCYTGPFQLEGRNYADQDWFYEVQRRGTFTSDVFLGFRNLPHLVIATKHEKEYGDFYILRATISAQMLSEQIRTAGMLPTDDVFLINHEGILQSPSRRYGDILTPIPLPVPHYSPGVEVFEMDDEGGEEVLVAAAFIESSPYLLMYLKNSREAMAHWSTLRNELLGFLAVSAALILGVILWVSNQFVNNMREASRRRAALLHQVEYSNKLASIGRLAAGVAHEINNPLAIINEKAGLLKDLLTLDETIPNREKLLGLIDSALGSVKRCRAITHRLLGFAKHMDLQSDTIDLPSLLEEVLGFLGKEAEYRDLHINVEVPDELPTIESDRGQLQQVFLNIFNNAFAAVEDGGVIDIAFAVPESELVTVAITDNGMGIPEQHLERIFEPFFSTKEGAGTGLGLSITYGIVKKLGGEIHVESVVGEGTRFLVILPVKRKG